MRDFLAENRSFRRYVLREIEQRGPLLSRELEDRAAGESRGHRWYGSAAGRAHADTLHQCTARSLSPAARQASASGTWPSAGTPRRRRCRCATPMRLLAEQRFRALGVRLEKPGGRRTPTSTDGRVPDA